MWAGCYEEYSIADIDILSTNINVERLEEGRFWPLDVGKFIKLEEAMCFFIKIFEERKIAQE